MDINKIHYLQLNAICMKYFGEVIGDYTSTALLLNAAEIAKERYQNNPNIAGLSTIAKIPVELKFQNDVDYTFKGKELVEKYKGDIIEKIASDYLIKNVSTIDAFLEDIYSIIIRTDSSLTDEQVGKKIRSAWANNNLRDCLLSEIDIKQPPKKISTPEMSFDVYESWRELRHSLMHNKGKLGQKHINKLQQLESKLPKESHLLHSPIIKGNKITLNYLSILILRQWVYSFIFYLDYSFHVTFIYKRLENYLNNGEIELKIIEGGNLKGEIISLSFENYNMEFKNKGDGRIMIIDVAKIVNMKK